MPVQSPPPDWTAAFRDVLTWIPASACWAYLARVAFHLNRHMHGKGRLSLPILLAEMPIAVFMGLAGTGLAEWLGLEGKAQVAVIAILGWFGPRAVEWLFAALAKQKTGADMPKDS